MHCVEEGIEKVEDECEASKSTDRVAIIDGMAVVNQLAIKGLRTCKDFASAFFDRLEHMVLGYTEVRLIFDRTNER